MKLNKIIILSPIKNEEKYLPYFIELWNPICDNFIFLLEPSSDNSENIIKNCAKAILIHNVTNSYNEKKRAELLVSEARKIFGSGNVLLAVDADEFPINDSKNLQEWTIIRYLPKGTTIIFNKPDLLPGLKYLLNNPEWALPLGYVDDGCSFSATKIHTTRVPISSSNVYRPSFPMLYHFNLVNEHYFHARRRYYCCLENVFGTAKWCRRYKRYSFSSNDNPLFKYNVQNLIPITSDLFKSMGLGRIGKNLFKNIGPYWQDHELVNLLNQYGFRRFLFEPIWQLNYKKYNVEILGILKASAIKKHLILAIGVLSPIIRAFSCVLNQIHMILNIVKGIKHNSMKYSSLNKTK